MKQLKKEYIASVTLILSVFVMMLLVLFGKLIYEIKDAKTSEHSSISWNARKEYPFENDINGQNGQKNFDEDFSKTEAKLHSIQTKIENNTTTYFRYRMPFVITKKRIEKALGLDMITSLAAGENDINDVGDIVVPYAKDLLGWFFDDVDISQNVQKLCQFGLEMKAQGRNFLFFENPEKYNGTDVYQDYSDEKYAEIQKAFDENGLDIISAQNLNEAYPDDLEKMYYRTDHHWTAASGIWADSILCDYLNENYGYKLDSSIFDMENYDAVLSDMPMMGSLGKKVTEVYAAPEEFWMYIPKYETRLDVFIPSKNINATGNIQETLFDYRVFEEKNMYLTNLYAFYGYGDQAFISIHNNDISNGSHILLVKASFADCMYPYLAAAVEDLDVVDVRHFDGSLKTYIKQSNPDTVIVIYGSGMFADEGDSDEDSFDFR